MSEDVSWKGTWPIGTQYLTRGKAPRLCTVVDILKTYNSEGVHVATRYISEHQVMGQTVTNYDVLATTIAIGHELLQQKAR